MGAPQRIEPHLLEGREAGALRLSQCPARAEGILAEVEDDAAPGPAHRFHEPERPVDRLFGQVCDHAFAHEDRRPRTVEAMRGEPTSERLLEPAHEIAGNEAKRRRSRYFGALEQASLGL